MIQYSLYNFCQLSIQKPERKVTLIPGETGAFLLPQSVETGILLGVEL